MSSESPKPTFRQANTSIVKAESDEVEDLKPSGSPMKVDPADESVEDKV
jgi:hypothetical protein